MEKTSNQRRKRSRRLVRRLTLGLGFAVALSPPSAGARDRSLSPRRAERHQPPWLESGGSPPPLLSPDSTEGPVHPAIHGERSGKVEPLFPRATSIARQRSERARAMASHPAGKAHESPTVEVERGDSLWSLAEERVGRQAASDCWPSLYRSNRRVVGPNPNHIEPGQVLEIPKECR